MYLRRGFGGFCVPPRQRVQYPRWMGVVPTETATEAIIDEAIEHAKRGRKDWPKPDDEPKRKGRAKSAFHDPPMTGRYA